MAKQAKGSPDMSLCHCYMLPHKHDVLHALPTQTITQAIFHCSDTNHILLCVFLPLFFKVFCNGENTTII